MTQLPEGGVTPTVLTTDSSQEVAQGTGTVTGSAQVQQHNSRYYTATMPTHTGANILQADTAAAL